MTVKTWGIGYEAALAKAKHLYSKIGRISCPFFNSEQIVFNRKGFTHILRRGKAIRPKAEQLIRLRLVEVAEAIVKMPVGGVVVEFRDSYEIERTVNRHGSKVLEKKIAKSWGFIAQVEGSEVTGVIGQVEGGQKEFLSIMANKYEVQVQDMPKQKAPPAR